MKNNLHSESPEKSTRADINALAEQMQRSLEKEGNAPIVSQTATYRHEAEKPKDSPPEENEPNMAELKKQLLEQVAGANAQKRKHSWKPILVALLAGFSYLAITYNEVAIAQVRQYISPGAAITTPVIVDPTQSVEIGEEPRIIIPKINIDVPVVYDVKTFDENEIQAGLERGVVHYGNTALPGQIGNNVIVGHSSNNFLNEGKYKFVFVLLNRLENGDTIILHYKGERYIYRVFNKEIIAPTDFRLIQPTSNPVVTLITCDPPGTNWRRLVVQAEQISPDPNAAEEVEQPPQNIEQTIVPGSSPSIWQRLGELF